MVTKEILKQHCFVEITNDFWQYSNNGVYGKAIHIDDLLKLSKDNLFKICRSFDKNFSLHKRPKVKKSINLDSLIRCIEDMFDEIENSERDFEDYEHYIYEEAIKCIYGQEAFDWMNEKT